MISRAFYLGLAMMHGGIPNLLSGMSLPIVTPTPNGTGLFAGSFLGRGFYQPEG